MPQKGAQYMWLFCMFDLPTVTAEEKRRAARFRGHLQRDGFNMIQYSVYARICNGHERVDKHMKRLQAALPPEGAVRAFQITDKQYGRMKILLSSEKKSDPKEGKNGEHQLVLF